MMFAFYIMLNKIILYLKHLYSIVSSTFSKFFSFLLIVLACRMKFIFIFLCIVEDLVTLHSTKLLSCYQIKCTMYLKDLKNIVINSFKFDTIQKWLINSSLSWLRTIICYLDQISPFEFILQVFSEYVYK